MSRAAILEWRSGGHRLAYVAAIAAAARAGGDTVDLYTTRDMTRTQEFQVHLAGTPALDVRVVRRLPWGLPEVVRRVRRDRLGLVVPEIDTYLSAFVLLAAARVLPRPTTGIVMRPPRRAGSVAARASGALKSWLIRTCGRFELLDLLLLEDPLGAPEHPVWPSHLLAAASPLYDLDDRSRTGGHTDATRLAHLPPDSPVVTVVGAIDSRKQVPLVLEAWRAGGHGRHATLLVAGAQTPDVRHAVDELGVGDDESILVIDSYLSTAEIGAVLERSKAVVVLYDGGFSSGILVSVAALGRWAIVDGESRTGRAALARGIGIPCEPTVESLSRALTIAIAETGSPDPVPLPSATDFGDTVLSRHVTP